MVCPPRMLLLLRSTTCGEFLSLLSGVLLPTVV